MKHSELKQLIKEELNKVLKENTTNYMFFQNLKTIKMMVDKLLTMDKNTIDGILLNGHDWAEDHIATSKDDVEEVYNFLVNSEMPNLDEKLKFTKEFNTNPKLKGKQKNLPDELQQKIINKK